MSNYNIIYFLLFKVKIRRQRVYWEVKTLLSCIQKLLVSCIKKDLFLTKASLLFQRNNKHSCYESKGGPYSDAAYLKDCCLPSSLLCLPSVLFFTFVSNMFTLVFFLFTLVSAAFTIVSTLFTFVST
jgi:hypothetical protein